MNAFSSVGKGDRQYLLQKQAHGTWYAVVEVPVKLRPILGKPRLIRSLQTSDLRAAQSKRWPVVAAFKAEISAALDQASNISVIPDLKHEAQEVRAELLKARHTANYGMVKEAINARIEAIYAQYARPHYDPDTGEELEPVAPEALTYSAVVWGEAEELDMYMERWLSGTTYSERTKADARTAVRDLQRWLKEDNRPAYLHKLDDRVASDYRDLGLKGKGVHPKTANKKLSALRQYWSWMTSSGFISPLRNPWDGKSLPKPKAFRSDPDSAAGQERPFTDNEIVTLLNGPADRDLSDIMRIAALSGMRLEEIGQLRVKDCVGGLLKITKSKTDAGVRAVPIHSALIDLIASRIGKAEGTDFLFPDLEDSGWDGTRTMALSKRFATYRRSVGVDDKREGARRSKVNFHSFRRWFARKCEEDGQPESVVARVMGHRKGVSITFALYSQAQPLEQMRKCVEAVQLPSGPPTIE